MPPTGVPQNTERDSFLSPFISQLYIQIQYSGRDAYGKDEKMSCFTTIVFAKYQTFGFPIYHSCYREILISWKCVVAILLRFEMLSVRIAVESRLENIYILRRTLSPCITPTARPVQWERAELGPDLSNHFSLHFRGCCFCSHLYKDLSAKLCSVYSCFNGSPMCVLKSSFRMFHTGVGH